MSTLFDLELEVDFVIGDLPPEGMDAAVQKHFGAQAYTVDVAGIFMRDRTRRAVAQALYDVGVRAE